VLRGGGGSIGVGRGDECRTSRNSGLVCDWLSTCFLKVRGRFFGEKCIGSEEDEKLARQMVMRV
jgi:hypothetical protein